MKERTKLQKHLVGPAGEYFVLYRLSCLGYLAAPAPAGTAVADLLILDPEETVVATLQVKTRTYGSDGGWHMKKKHETIDHPRLFYAFVDLEPEVPKVFVIPSKIVAGVCRESHSQWLASPGKKGQLRKDGEMRRLLPAYSYDVPGFPAGWMDRYLEKWEVLTGLVKRMNPESLDTADEAISES